MTDIKVGDIVHVRGRVHNIEPRDSASYTISFYEGRDYALVTRAEIAHVEPRQFKVGDKVKPNWSGSHEMTIIAIEGQFAWLKSHDPRMTDTRCTLSLDKLTLAENK